MASDNDLDTEVSEIASMTLDAVHAVKGPASGATFLILKAMADDPNFADTVAAVEDLAKAEMSSAETNDLPDSAFAYIEGGGKKDAEGKTTPRSLRHYPVNDAAHTRAALARASGAQSPFAEDAMPKIRAAAKKFGVEVAKAEATEGITTETGLHGSPLAKGDTMKCPTCNGVGSVRTGTVECPDCGGTGEVPEGFVAKATGGIVQNVSYVLNESGGYCLSIPQPHGFTWNPPAYFSVTTNGTAYTLSPVVKADDGSPGSASWEADDAANLSTAAGMLASVSEALEVACDREEAEVEAGASDDIEDVWDLGCALDCLQTALSIVGRLAFSEQAESASAEVPDDDMAVMDMVKAGKRLSTKSEQSLKDAMATLAALLAGDGQISPSSTQDTPDKGAAGTTKEEDMEAADLAKALADNNAALTTAITTGLADVLKSALAPQTPAAPEVAKETAVAKSDAITENTPTDTAPNFADLVKSIGDAVKEAVAPVVEASAALEDRVAKMENRPQRGTGPLQTVPRGGTNTGIAPLGAMPDLGTRYAEADALVKSARTPEELEQASQMRSLLSLSAAYDSGNVHKFDAPEPRFTKAPQL